MKISPARLRIAALLSTIGLVVFRFSPVILFAAGGEDQGKLVHVADTRHLTGFNLFIADLYNSNRLEFTLVTVGLTVLLGFTLGLVMDALVSAIGLDLGRRTTRE